MITFRREKQLRPRPKYPILLSRQALLESLLRGLPHKLAQVKSDEKILILGLTTTVIALASLTASAGSDAQYPAANFQPKVIYLDKDSIKPSTTSTQCSPSKIAAKEIEFDAKYPAANFQPKIIYP